MSESKFKHGASDVKLGAGRSLVSAAIVRLEAKHVSRATDAVVMVRFRVFRIGDARI